NLQPPTFNLQPSTSNLQPPTFNLQPSTSNLQPPRARTGRGVGSPAARRWCAVDVPVRRG
ncbi:MAG: hypothetical protein WHT63_11035, partial [Tepidiforma sp.]